MAESMLLPKLSNDMTQGVITKWYKGIGETVQVGDTLVEIETGATTMELESYTGGVLLFRTEAREIAVDRLICIIGGKEEDIDHLLKEDERKGTFFVRQSRSIRTFIGARDFEVSRVFYQELGFHEFEVSGDMSYFSAGQFGFYLQRYYVKDWVDNSMVFMEVNDAQETYRHLESLRLHHKYQGVRLVPVKEEDWGRECFLHDPSGVLWHFGEFY